MRHNSHWKPAKCLDRQNPNLLQVWVFTHEKKSRGMPTLFIIHLVSRFCCRRTPFATGKIYFVRKPIRCVGFVVGCKYLAINSFSTVKFVSCFLSMVKFEQENVNSHTAFVTWMNTEDSAIFLSSYFADFGVQVWELPKG